MREDKKEALVVGAGPVGLWTALELAEAGLQAAIIDREVRTASRSYACALHPRALRGLKRFGLAEAAVSAGRKVSRVAFYDLKQRRAEVDLASLGGTFPFLLVVPQNTLEGLLESRLAKAGVRVHWNHRFDTLDNEMEIVAAQIEELQGSSSGYIVPHWDMMVKSRSPLRVQFLLGADGHNSLVRSRVGIEHARVSGPEFFAAYEFLSDQPGEDEIRVVLEPGKVSVLWPLPGNRFRWTFQIAPQQLAAEFPQKERRSVRVANRSVDDRIRGYVQKVSKERAPWFNAEVKEITWCTQVHFERRMVRHFGNGRCWLLGDAAHQTGPVGVQSMNAGFAEAEAIVPLIKRIVEDHESMSVLAGYENDQQQRWRRLLGLTGGLKPQANTDAWLTERAGALLPCLPGLDSDLVQLANQLGLNIG